MLTFYCFFCNCETWVQSSHDCSLSLSIYSDVGFLHYICSNLFWSACDFRLVTLNDSCLFNLLSLSSSVVMLLFLSLFCLKLLPTHWQSQGSSFCPPRPMRPSEMLLSAQEPCLNSADASKETQLQMLASSFWVWVFFRPWPRNSSLYHVSSSLSLSLPTSPSPSPSVVLPSFSNFPAECGRKKWRLGLKQSR